MQNIQKWPILIYISFISARKRRVQLFQKVHPLHNSWSNENLQCKCQYMAKGWFSRFWQHWKSWQCKEKDDFNYQTKNILISCFRNINSHIICSKWKATTRMIWEFWTPTFFFYFSSLHPQIHIIDNNNN